MSTIKAPPLHHIAIAQILSLLVISLLAMTLGKTVACSVLIGGVVHIVPQAWFARMAYRYSGARQAPRILNAIYKGEAGKLLLTAVMFALTFYYVQPLQVTAVFAGYVAMIIVYGYSAAKVIQPKNKPQ